MPKVINGVRLSALGTSTFHKAKPAIEVSLDGINDMEDLSRLLEDGHKKWKSTKSFSKMDDAKEKWQRAYQLMRVMISLQDSLNMMIPIESVPQALINYIESLIGRPFKRHEHLDTVESMFGYVLLWCEIHTGIDKLDKTIIRELRVLDLAGHESGLFAMSKEGGRQRSSFVYKDILRLTSTDYGAKQEQIEHYQRKATRPDRNPETKDWALEQLEQLKSNSVPDYIRWVLSRMPAHHRRIFIGIPSEYLRYFEQVHGY